MTWRWTEVASHAVLNALLKGRQRPSGSKLLSMRVIELPLGPVTLQAAVELADSLGGCSRRQNALTVVQHYAAICDNGYCRCTDLCNVKITVKRFAGWERIEVEVQEPVCAHRGNWNEVTEQQFARSLTAVREASERHWGHDRYPDRQVWFAEFHCGGHR